MTFFQELMVAAAVNRLDESLLSAKKEEEDGHCLMVWLASQR